MTSIPALSGLAASAILAAAPALAADHQVWRAHADPVLGTSFDMAVTASSQAEAHIAFTAALVEIARLDKALSVWRPTSEISALNGAEQHVASPDLFAVLSACEAWRERTDGAFNAGLGAIEDAWRGGAPTAEALCGLAANARPLSLDRRTRTVARPLGVRVAPDGLAKGYILDAALSAARRAAPCASGVMIDIGGDIVCFGRAAEGAPWRIGVAALGHAAENAAPIDTLALTGKALAVSGSGPRDRIVGGMAVSHLIHARTGAPAPGAQVAVVADRATDADAAATALAALPPEEALVLAERLPGVEALIQAPDGQRMATSAWPGMACQAPLPSGFSVDIDYELPRIEVGNYRRPYTVIWITDAERNLVKTLHIAGSKPSWMEENYVWYRRFGRRNPGQIDSQGKPTRPPGRYTVAWDGTNDAGQRVPQGPYIVHIEAAREHGGHGYQQIPLTLGARATDGDAGGNDELGSARAKYDRKD